MDKNDMNSGFFVMQFTGRWMQCIFLLLLITGCEAYEQEASPHQPTWTVKDGLDRDVQLVGKIDRVVSLSPKNTEMLFAIGAGDQVVGVTEFCNFPPAALKRERVGGYAGAEISVEKIISLEPDVVLSEGKIHQQVTNQLERMKIPVVALDANTFDSLYDEIQLLGHITRHQKQAAALVGELKSRVTKVVEGVRDIEPEDRVTAMYYTWGAPLTVAGPASYLGEMIETSGAVNIVTDDTVRYQQISEEVVIDQDPDVIVAATMAVQPITKQYFMDKDTWRGMSAIKNGRICIIEGDLCSRFGPRFVQALEAMARGIYPNRFPEVSADPSSVMDDEKGSAK